MNPNQQNLTLLILFFLTTTVVFAQSDTLKFDLNVNQIQDQIFQAPNILNTKNKQSNRLVTLPSLDGKQHTYYVFETINMEEPLYSQFPEIRSYILLDKHDPSRTGRLSTGVNGMNIMIKKNGQHQYIAPLAKKGKYQMYQSSLEDREFTCGVEDIEKFMEESNENRSAQATLNNGATLRTYRMAVATTGEFFVSQGNTTASVLARVNNYINLLNEIYENEVSAHFNLIGNNTALLFNNAATDGLDPTNGNTQVNSSQTVINNTIGASNYDIGHTFYTAPGACCSAAGVAGQGVICDDANKAAGWTGATATASDEAWMIVFAHEVGHQFGAHHSMYGTANFCVQRNPGSGYEPGSGSSLMSYRGICGAHNIEPQVSTLYFHNHSLNEIINGMNSHTCHTNSATNNAIPVVTAPANRTIPRDTPFELIGSATDADGDAIIYNWEEFDTDTNVLGQNAAAGNPNAAATSTTAPLFRSFDPSPDGNLRTFPALSDIINNTQTFGEILPSVNRNMKFRLTARDFKVGGGAVSCDEVDLTVDANIGPFEVTSQAASTAWSADGSNTATVTWDVAGTNSLCTDVDILFSTDEGITFPFTIANNVANNGSHTFTIPSYPTTLGRIKVKCSDNYFFNINRSNISLTSNCEAVSATFSPDADIDDAQGSNAFNLSLSPNFGAAIGNINGTLSATDQISSLPASNGGGGCTNFNANVTTNDSYTLQVASTSLINFQLASGAFGTIISIYEGDYDPANPCTNFIASTYDAATAGLSNNLVQNLTAGFSYTLVVGTFNTGLPALPAPYTISHSGGNLYDGTPPPNANFDFTFIAVNQANGIITSIDANSDFTSLAAGTYEVYGISFENTVNINSYVGASFTSFQSDAGLLLICAAQSANSITLTVQSNVNCATNSNGTISQCLPINWVRK